MLPQELLPNIENLHLIALKIDNNELVITTRIDSGFYLCPACKCSSSKQHSYYIRQLSDVAWAGVPTTLNLKVHKFFCESTNCQQKIFTERIEGLPSYARRTNRQKAQLEAIGLRTGANEGTCLCKRLGIKVSSSTILKILHQIAPPCFKAPKVLEVDDWAFRKGHVYGTILVDLEEHKPIDLLPDREAETLEKWLKEHPGVEIISRDRASAYSIGAKNGAPDAIEVADRWHLLKNMTDALKRMMYKHNKINQEIALSIAEKNRAVIQSERKAIMETNLQLILPSTEKKESTLQYEETFKLVKDLQNKGLSRRAIAQQLNISRVTVNKYFHFEKYPKRTKSETSKSTVAKFDGYIQKIVSKGEYSIQQLWEDLQEKGFKGNAAAIRRYMNKHFPKEKKAEQLPALEVKLYSPKRLGYLLIREKEKLKEKEIEYLEQLFVACPQAQLANQLALRFRNMIVNRKAENLETWIKDTIVSGTEVLKSFAQNLNRNFDAVYNACSLEWSNGQVEGQVNRLKNIKRQMYGRASFELLKKVVLTDSG
ncbi:MAG: transposase [Paraglaciecola sp.]|jgi:transposase